MLMKKRLIVENGIDKFSHTEDSNRGYVSENGNTSSQVTAKQ